MKEPVKPPIYSAVRTTDCVESPSSASVLLCLNDVIFIFKQDLTAPLFKHMENMFMYTNMISMCLKFRVTRYCLQKNGTF